MEEQKTQLDERIINRLQKVLALTTSPMEGEAQAAAAKLAELLTLYNLSIADLEMRGKAEKPGVKEEGHDLGKAAFTWKLNLAEGIARFYYCYPMVDRKQKSVAFVGRKDNVESLKMLYGWLIDQIRRISADERKLHVQNTGEHIDPLRWQVNFGIGAVNRLKERLAEKAKQEQEANKAVMALVVHHDTEISDYLEQQYGWRADGKRTKEQERWEREYQERQKAREDLKAKDPEEYYRQYPWDRPEDPAEVEKRNREWRKKQDRRERARARYYETHGRSGRQKTFTEEDYRKMEQGRRSKQAGYAAGDKINLEPFVEGPKTRVQVG